MTPDNCIDIGADMWLSIAEHFNTAMQVDGITDLAEQALVYAGFISAMSGGMLAVLGPEVARQILDQAKEGCSKCSRAQLTVVPK